MTTVYSIDPLEDPRWGEFVERHPRASVFHTPGWLEALRRTYGYGPVVYTTTPPGSDLTNGIVVCRVHSWITGRRLVSLPFADHCEPLVDRPEHLEGLLRSLERDCSKDRCHYLEIRPRTVFADPPAGLQPAQVFSFHTLDLSPELEKIFRACHKDAVQRKITRAEREGLTYEEGRGEALLEKFYQLLLRTRRRQRLAPPPRDWFGNLVNCLGDKVKIRVASKNGRPIASILTLSFQDVVVYKYSCSDERFHNLGGTQLLLWNAIQEGKRDGALELDLGRSDPDNHGLITFKNRWGAIRCQLTYLRYSERPAPIAVAGRRMQAAQKIFARLPDSFLRAAGQILYKHIG